MLLNIAERKLALRYLMSAKGIYIFDGHPVCDEFFVKVFRFARDLRCFVKVKKSALLLRREPASHCGILKGSSRDSIVPYLS